MSEFAASADRNPPDSSLERAILAFEQAWRADSPPSIATALTQCQPGIRRELACELTVIDMEFRWQASAKGRPPQDALGARPTWLDYAAQLVEVGEIPHLPPQLIAEEYRVRQLWGDRPSHDRFASQYADHLTRLPKWLSRIDAELRADDVEIAASPPPFAPAAFDPRAPLPWSDYIVQQHLGSGGFGKVYRAIQKSLDRPVAVKALHKARQKDPQAVEQFIQEARLLPRLQHHGIVGVHGLGRYPGGGYFLVLDLIDGEDLQRRIDRGPLSIGEAVRITVAVAEAIHYAHEHGVLHGDLKPANVLVDRNGAVSVTDFGLGHLLPSARDGPAIAPVPGGTLPYLAPEAARDGRTGVPSDIYGLGAFLYASLTGQPPQPGGADLAFNPARQQPVREPSSLRTDLPPELDHLVMKCLSFEPAARYETAADVAAALLAAPSGNTNETASDAAMQEDVRNWP